MPIPSPNLDDRTFDQLLAEAKVRIARSCPEWTDRSVGDPGMVLLELFAHLTEVMIYRLNRIPEKAYIEFLNLIGLRLEPPSAAVVTLKFTRSRPSDQPLEIPRNTRVTLNRSIGGGEPPVFATAQTVTIEPGKNDVDALAYHAELIEAESAGYGTGLPGHSVVAKRPPIIAPTGDDTDLIVGVEVARTEIGEREAAVQQGDKVYRIWKPLETFANLPPNYPGYVADRFTGTITFAPAVRRKEKENSSRIEDVPQALAAVPPTGREIRLWYRRGGGPAGNVAANTITTLKDPIPGVSVTNPAPSIGGRAAETLENALIRGPQEFHSLRRAVTASDFEILARRSSGAVARAKAFTKAQLWAHATPGTVEVLLVPNIGESAPLGEPLTAGTLREHHTAEALTQIQNALDERRPLGTTCLVNWAHYKTVRTKARVVAHREENIDALRARVLERLYRTINPMSWRFGTALRASHIYDIILAEPGVNYVDSVRLLVDEVPDRSVERVAVDAFQPHTWYAASGAALFRSLNDGDGWERAEQFPDEIVGPVRVHPKRPGLLALASRLTGDKAGSGLRISFDCGESWPLAVFPAFEIEDLAWTVREGAPFLLLATSVGLYEYAPRPGATPDQILVDANQPDLGFYAIAVSSDDLRGVRVVVAAQEKGGVFLCNDQGKPTTFHPIGLKDQDVRVLEVQYVGAASFIWAGFAAEGDDPGTGCARAELLGDLLSTDNWQTYSKGWREARSGSCWSLAFVGWTVYAGCDNAGVLRVDASRGQLDAAWTAPAIGCGLPTRGRERIFQRVRSVAANPKTGLLLAATSVGIYRSSDGGVNYESCSRQEQQERVTLPETWLFCSGTHEIEVKSEDEATGN